MQLQNIAERNRAFGIYNILSTALSLLSSGCNSRCEWWQSSKLFLAMRPELLLVSDVVCTYTLAHTTQLYQPTLSCLQHAHLLSPGSPWQLSYSCLVGCCFVFEHSISSSKALFSRELLLWKFTALDNLPELDLAILRAWCKGISILPGGFGWSVFIAIGPLCFYTFDLLISVTAGNPHCGFMSYGPMRRANIIGA